MADNLHDVNNLPPINLHKKEMEYPDESDQIRHLQYLAYKAQFAEDISKKMRVPDQLTFVSSEAQTNSSTVVQPKNDKIKEMKVPSKITLNSAFDRDASKISNLNDVTLNKTSDLDLHLVNKDISQSVVLKTPPRVLKIGDIDNFSPENIGQRNQKRISQINKTESEVNQNDEVNQLDEHISDEFNDFFNFPTDEDVLMTRARQQIYSLHRRITTIEKKLEISQNEMKFSQIVSYSCIAVTLALGIMVVQRTRDL